MYLTASMMCADISQLKEQTISLDNAGVDGFHIDVMDGEFVDNLSLGKEDVQAISENTKLPLDIHLMVNHPLIYMKYLSVYLPSIYFFHFESLDDPLECVSYAKKQHVRPGLVINPETSLEDVRALLPKFDLILIMTVHPGFSGQNFINSTIQKIREVKKITSQRTQIFVDGALSIEKIYELSNIGVYGFVLGSSCLFIKNKSFEERISKIRSWR
ncbi:ribulose-phosphate 3-epimerase [Rummeliibacillus suwonensis]|uniref:ribulose-phosphate 3-epimerase n=1 Tax=Rummeliibacillus suwonensis TaxID=1306154 RepID=UPI001AAE8C7A|nr:ribulose-phosphate 3-epimerase [Rummeliibacillus suwonensis]MBO2535615.1 ribulose-phosphate 3-epimerase [Rummeliibacillus suwonensis]